MTTLDLLTLILASRAFLDAWTQEGGLFAGPKARMQAVGGMVGKLASCRFCQSYHVSLWVTVPFILSYLLPQPFGIALRLPAYWLAATTGVHLLDEIIPFSEGEIAFQLKVPDGGDVEDSTAEAGDGAGSIGGDPDGDTADGFRSGQGDARPG